jgi:hypothetical protein
MKKLETSQVSRDTTLDLRFSSMSLADLLSQETRDHVFEAHKNVSNFYDAFKITKIKLGEYFSYLKLKAGHGNFAELLKKEYPNISTRTIRRYIASYLNKDKTLDKIIKDPEKKKVQEKKKRGETLTPSEKVTDMITTSAYQLRKAELLFEIHGVKETLDNFISLENREILVKDIQTKTDRELLKLDKSIKQKRENIINIETKLKQQKREAKLLEKEKAKLEERNESLIKYKKLK